MRDIKVSDSASCSKQGQWWEQMELVRALSCWVWIAILCFLLQADQQLGVGLYKVEVDLDNKNLLNTSSFTLN